MKKLDIDHIEIHGTADAGLKQLIINDRIKINELIEKSDKHSAIISSLEYIGVNWHHQIAELRAENARMNNKADKYDKIVLRLWGINTPDVYEKLIQDIIKIIDETGTRIIQ